MKKHSKINFSFMFSLAIALVICVSATVFSVGDIQRSSYLERAKTLNMVMAKIGEHLNIAFDTKWNKVRFFSAHIEESHTSSIDDLTAALKNFYLQTGENIKVVDDDGIAYYYDGTQEYWKDHKRVEPNTETFILSSLQFGDTDENYMKYIVPMKEPVKIGDRTIVYTVLTEPLSALQRDFDTANYGNGCLAFIIDKQGTFIYENGSDDLMADSYNFLAYLERTAVFSYGETFETFKQNINDGVSNTCLIEYNGCNYYLCHFDLDMENWASILLVPEQNIQAESQTFTQKLLGNIAIVFGAVLVVFIIGFLYMWKKTVTKQRVAAEAERLSNEAKTNFLSSMSHDIRTPVNAIIGMTEIALHNKKDVPRSVRENLEQIRLSSSHLLMLINDILDISKIESGKMSLNIAEFSIVESSNTLANVLRPLAKEKGIDLRMHTYNFRQEYIWGDELRLNQVSINLASNAIKYTPKGGSVVVDFKQQDVPDNPDKVRVVFSVSDNGIGINEDYQKEMYEVFSRGTDSRVNKVSGSGLGLPICLKLIKMMGGKLDCESVLGQGTTFTASVVLDRGKPDEEYRLPKLSALVVDSDRVSTAALKQIFERLQVESDAVNVSSRLDSVLALNKSYQLAFVELGSPQNSGLETAKRLRERFGKNFPIILTDIADMTEYSEQIASVGLKHKMNKPYFYRTVYQTILDATNAGNADCATQESIKGKALNGMNLLVAEDNDLNWAIINEILNMNGVKAHRAVDGKVCVEILNCATPMQYDAVLMDVRMPVMNGLEAMRIIRQSDKKWLQEINIVAMTADAFAEDIQHCLEAGMNSHLSKPINIDRLLSVLINIKNQNDSNRKKIRQK